MSRTSKQIIIMRKEFIVNGERKKLRTGKYCSQSAHASLGAILNQMDVNDLHDFQLRSLYLYRDSALYDWINNAFTKICCYVDTEEELLDVYNKAKAAGLLCSWIVDSGLTEFGGVPTVTCCAIGPAWSDELEPITGNLKLF